MIKFLSMIILMMLTGAISVGVLMFGWGLEVQSWEWIIGGYIAILAIGVLSSAITGD